jgi:hypothetical protein
LTASNHAKSQTVTALVLIRFAASFHGHITSHSSKNGDIQWSFDAGSSVTTIATAQTSDGRSDDVIVIGSAAGSVNVLSSVDGALLWTAVFDGSVAVAAGELAWQHSYDISVYHQLTVCWFQLAIASLHSIVWAVACTPCIRTTVRA